MKYNTESFIQKAKEIHGEKYDYSKVKYVDHKTKVCIICPTHGEFWIRPSHHINKGRTNQRGCPKCGEVKRRQNARKNTEWFIEKAKELHGNRYDYSKTEYVHSLSGVCITCPTHGDFWMPPHRHLQGHGCPKCGGHEKLTTEKFIEKSKQVHGNRYDYSKSEYKGNFEKVCIICPKHGEFWQYANQHMQGRGCPHCRQSSLEREVREFLEKEGIEYVAQKRSKWLSKQSLDFYLPKYKLAIECQGIQHFILSKYFGGEERYKKTTELDKNKNKICEERGINILYYSHYDYDYEFEIINDLITLRNRIYGFRNVSKD